MTDLYRRVLPVLFVVVLCAFLWTSVRLGDGGTPIDFLLWVSTVCALALIVAPADPDLKG